MQRVPDQQKIITLIWGKRKTSETKTNRKTQFPALKLDSGVLREKCVCGVCNFAIEKQYESGLRAICVTRLGAQNS